MFFSLFMPTTVVFIICIIILHQLIPVLIEKNVNTSELINLITMILLFMVVLLLSVTAWTFKRKVV